MIFQTIFGLNLEFPSETADLLDFPLRCLYKHKGNQANPCFGGKFQIQIENSLKNLQKSKF